MRQERDQGQVQLQARGLRNMLHQHRREERESLPGEGSGISAYRQDQGMRPARPQIDWGLSGGYEIVCTYKRVKDRQTTGRLRSRRRRLDKRGVQHAPGVTGVGGRYGRCLALLLYDATAARCDVVVPSSMESREVQYRRGSAQRFKASYFEASYMNAVLIC